MKPWKIRISALCLGCAAVLLLAPVTLTALGLTSSSESASTPQSAPAPAQTERVSAASGVNAPPAPSPKEMSAMDRQIREWMAALSKEKEFEAWRGAAWETYPLGPGTHSWLVLVRSGGQELGYMVISSTENRDFKLVEYGAGEYPLFSLNTLYQTMVQRGIIPETFPYSTFIIKPPVSLTRWYVPPLQAVWQVETAEGQRYFDAKTGEELPDVSGWIQPLEGEVLSREPAPAPAPGASVEEAKSWEPADPFVRPGWVKGKPLQLETFESWKKALGTRQSPVTYKGDWYGGLAIYPLAVSGYHRWSGGPDYIRLEHSGSRYIPFDDAALLGGYYPNL